MFFLENYSRGYGYTLMECLMVSQQLIAWIIRDKTQLVLLTDFRFNFLAIDVQVNAGHVLAREDANLGFVVIYSKSRCVEPVRNDI